MTAVETAKTDPAPPAVSASDISNVLARGEQPARPGPWRASVAFGWRAMLKIKHVPEQLFDVTLFPVMMTLMFTYLFGGALAGSTQEYLQFLLPGIMVMSVVMITMYTASAVHVDFAKGFFDRVRTLSIWRPAPMVGYLLGDALRYAVASLVIIALGLILGFRPEGGAVGVALGIGLLLAFSFALSWIWTLFGLIARSEKAVMGWGMMLLFPLTFMSNIFVEPETMPGWLQAFVNVSPITHLVAAVRGVVDGNPDLTATFWTAVYTVTITVIFGTATMWVYNRK